MADPQSISQAINSRQTVDPEVSRAKFERELGNFKQVETHYRERGIILLRASFPDILLAFTAARMRPLMTVFAVKINFTNYDLEAPSVQFIDPLTEAPVKLNQLGSFMPRKAPGTGTAGQTQAAPNISYLIQAHQPHQIPFVCLPGVREYHHHPYHSNDPWFSHRRMGEGTLGFLIDQLHQYGTHPINGYCPQSFNVQQPAPGVVQVQSQGLIFTIDIASVPL
ncbi:putative metal-binding protein [Mucilaginibacter sabulilitoris]|uniref:Metal-binding protein n=1 Tax=Mucilaginibacter sabulilitoris TaxID=1173583 RepID=A0ABZ0TNN9_9SPHI|nr:putative metal-binding protein [Mucilaginibacter sabulilitoris]WPU94755.1 putative metal-binding protein [Mucilaginibacter sabulilitoris]